VPEVVLAAIMEVTPPPVTLLPVAEAVLSVLLVLRELHLSLLVVAEEEFFRAQAELPQPLNLLRVTADKLVVLAATSTLPALVLAALAAPQVRLQLELGLPVVVADGALLAAMAKSPAQAQQAEML
jgi:hypothetical protein